MMRRTSYRSVSRRRKSSILETRDGRGEKGGGLIRSSLPIVRPVPGQKIVPIKTQARAATILPNFVGLKFQVHNGKIYNDVLITEDMVGHKLGEFSP
jgi:ribosomal protein S19